MSIIELSLSQPMGFIFSQFSSPSHWGGGSEWAAVGYFLVSGWG